MKIAFSSTGPDLNSEVDLRFGRCPYYIIINLDDTSFEAIPNTDPSCGAGVRVATTIVDKNVEIIYTGNIGPNAVEVLTEANIEINTGISGVIREIMLSYLNKQFAISLEN